MLVLVNHESRIFSWFIYRMYDDENIPDTIKGNWLLKPNTYTDGNIDSNHVIEMHLKDRTHSLNITEENGKLVLWNFVGDPDQGSTRITKNNKRLRSEALKHILGTNY